MHSAWKAGLMALLGGIAVAPAVMAAGAESENVEELASLLSAPVYAASKYQQTVADAPAAVTVITQGEIRSFGWQTLAEVVGAVRSVYTRYDRDYTYIGVRGLGRPGDYSSRLLILVDGVRLNDNIYDSVLAGREFPLDVEMIDRVEFIPGPGSSVHGSNAVLGTINLITRDASNLRGGNAVAGFDTQKGVKAFASLADDSPFGTIVGSVSVESRPGQTLTFPEFDSPEVPGGVIRGMDRERAARLYLRLEHGDFKWSALAGWREKEIPNAPYGLVVGDPSAVWVDTLSLVGVSWQPEPVEGAGWYGQLGLGRYTYGDHGRYEPDHLLVRYQNLGVWLHGELNRTVRVSESNLLLVGLDIQRDQKQKISERYLEPVEQPATELKTDGTRFGLYLSEKIDMGSGWTLDVGARADRNVFGHWAGSPKAALIWRPRADIVLKAMGGRAYREPNVYERAASDLSDNWNNELRREKVASSEVAAEWQPSEHFRGSASVYRYVVSQMMEQVTDEDSGQLVYQNVGGAHVRGAELEIEGRTESGLRGRLSLTRLHAESVEGERLSNSPHWQAKFHGTAQLPHLPLRVAAEVQALSARLTESGDRIASRIQTNLSLNWNPPGSDWSMGLTVRNLFDHLEIDPTSTEFVSDRVAQDGREVMLRVYVGF